MALLLAGCGLRESALDKARAAYDKNDLVAAALEVRNALQKNPLDAEAQLLLGRILIGQGNALAGAKEISKAAQLGIDPSRADPLRARALVLAGDYRRVLDEIKPAHSGEPLGAILAARGQAHLMLKQVAEAEAAFAESVEQAPENPDALLGQAQLAYSARDIAGALALVERALARAPRSADAWFVKGSLLVAQGRVDDAVASYGQAAVLAPAGVHARLAAAETLIGAGKFDAAQSHLDRVLRRAPGNPHANHVQALLFFRQKNYDKASEFVQLALKQQPNHGPATLLAGMVGMAQGSVQEAESHLKLWLQVRPGDVFARKLYASALLKRNNSQGAVEALAPALDSGSGDAGLFELAAEAYAKTKDFSRSQALLDKAVELREKDPRALVSLGLRQLAEGDAARGMAQLEKAAALDSGDFGADYALAGALLRRGEFEKALAAALRMEKKQPSSPIPPTLAGAALLSAGDKAQARKSFERAAALDAGYLPAALSLAQLDMEERRPDAARKRIEAVVARDKTNFQALAALARISGDSTQLITSLEAARKHDRKALVPRLALVDQYLAQGQADKALAVAQETTAALPDNVDALSALGSAQLAAGRKNDAVASFGKVVAAAPESSVARVRLAQAHVAVGNTRAAESEYRKAIGLKPDDVEAGMGLATLYAQGGALGDAMKIAKAIQKRLPRLAAGYLLEGDLLVRQQKFADAAKAYQAGFTAAPTGFLLTKLHAARKTGGQDPGQEQLQQWLNDHPADSGVRMFLADQQLVAGQIKTAIDNYLLVVKAEPTNARALNNLANAYLAAKDARAVETAQAAYKLRPGDPNVIDTLGWALTETGKAARGAEMLKTAVELAPDSTEFRLHYAVALAKSGDKQRARLEVRRLIDAGKDVKLDAAMRALLQ